jgi:hypothetical protein
VLVGCLGGHVHVHARIVGMEVCTGCELTSRVQVWKSSYVGSGVITLELRLSRMVCCAMFWYPSLDIWWHYEFL